MSVMGPGHKQVFICDIFHPEHPYGHHWRILWLLISESGVERSEF